MSRRKGNSYNGLKNLVLFAGMVVGVYWFFNSKSYGFQQNRSKALAFLKVGDGVVVSEKDYKVHIRKYKGAPTIISEVGEDFVLVKTGFLEKVYPIYNIWKIELDAVHLEP